MGKLFYGTQTGTSEYVAEWIQQAMPELITEYKNIYKAQPEDLQACDFLVLGGSTWGDGELPDDWADWLPKLEKANLKGKKVALFGLGDQVGYSYNFVSAMRVLYDEVVRLGADVIGNNVSTEGFDFGHSEAVVDGHFVGLVVDEINESHLTKERIEKWANTLKPALATVKL